MSLVHLLETVELVAVRPLSALLRFVFDGYVAVAGSELSSDGVYDVVRRLRRCVRVAVQASLHRCLYRCL